MQPEVTWFGRGNRWRVGKRIAGSGKSRDLGKPLTRLKIGSRAHAPGSHVVWKGKPLTSMKKGIAGSGKSRDLGKPLTS